MKTKNPIKVGDYVKVYVGAESFKGIIDGVEELTGLIHFRGQHETVHIHYKQCRRLVKKPKVRVVEGTSRWVYEDENLFLSPGVLPPTERKKGWREYMQVTREEGE